MYKWLYYTMMMALLHYSSLCSVGDRLNSQQQNLNSTERLLVKKKKKLALHLRVNSIRLTNISISSHIFRGVLNVLKYLLH